MVYAVIAAGGRQYKVSPGDVIRVEKLGGEEGKAVVFDKVLLVNNDGNLDIGAPYLENSAVAGKVVRHGRGDKIRVIRFKRRKRHLRRLGHRQPFTAVEITGINP